MKFLEIAQIFERLESTSKRLEKIVILRDLLEKDEKNSIIIFDIISGNFQRRTNKKTLGISIKTIFDVLAFVSKKTQKEIEKMFSKIGDVGEIAKQILTESKQKSLFGNDLTLNEILNAYEKISKKTGTNSNKIKKEILSNLFLSAKSECEYKFLARLLIDDLRVGVSEGVLKESVVNYIFPYIEGINYECKNCKFINLANKKCVNCQEEINLKDNEFSIENFDMKTPKEVVGLNNFVKGREFDEEVKYIIRHSKKNQVIITEKGREYYNEFIKIIEKNYNVVNDFKILFERINQDKNKLLNVEIVLGVALRSMLGSRANSVDEAFNFTGKPSFIDYKYDGLRVQIHNNKGEITLFSRNLDNITKQFPEVVEYIKKNFSDLSFVIDSECVGYNFESKEFLPFQQLSRRIMTKDFNEVKHINVALRTFDIMYLNGETLLELSYEQRREKMNQLLIGRELIQKKYVDNSKLREFNMMN